MCIKKFNFKYRFFSLFLMAVTMCLIFILSCVLMYPFTKDRDGYSIFLENEEIKVESIKELENEIESYLPQLFKVEIVNAENIIIDTIEVPIKGLKATYISSQVYEELSGYLNSNALEKVLSKTKTEPILLDALIAGDIQSLQTPFQPLIFGQNPTEFRFASDNVYLNEKDVLSWVRKFFKDKGIDPKTINYLELDEESIEFDSSRFAEMIIKKLQIGDFRNIRIILKSI